MDEVIQSRLYAMQSRRAPRKSTYRHLEFRSRPALARRIERVEYTTVFQRALDIRRGFVMQKFKSVLLAITLTAIAGAALAHHSFAVYFDSNKTVSVTGVVSNFSFRNPHGVLTLKVTSKTGAEEEWKGETNSPSVLERRGWTKDSVKAGDTVTLEGWPARNGANLVRIRKVTRANGETIGGTLDPTEQK